MSYATTLKIYEYLSYLMIVAATVIYFALKPNSALLTMVVLVLAVFMRLMMERTRRKALEEENDELKNDLRRLTALLEKKERNS